MRKYLFKLSLQNIVLVCVFIITVALVCPGCSGQKGIVVDKTNESSSGKSTGAKSTDKSSTGGTGTAENTDKSSTGKTGTAENTDENSIDEGTIPGNDVSDNTNSEKIVVYVCGAVNQAGVYELSEESRVCDAVNAAGGMSPDAAADNINLATIISDGAKIRVPFNGEELQDKDVAYEGVSEENATSGSDTGKVNINTATKEELMTLSGIGEAKAASIISYRESNGGFSDIGQLKEIEGIKDGVYNKIKDNICVK